MAAPSYGEVNKRLQDAIMSKVAPDVDGGATPQPAPLSQEDQVAAAVGAQAMQAASPKPEEGPSTLSQIGSGLAETFLTLLPQGAAYATGEYEGLQRQKAEEKESLARQDVLDKEKRDHAAKLAEKRLEIDAKKMEAKLKQTEKAENREIQLREELGKNKQVMSAAESGQSFTVLQNLYKQAQSQPDAIKDVSLVYNFVKALDPGSTVRESEADLIQNAKGLMGAVPGLYERIKSGQKLLPEQRDAMMKAAADAYQGRVQNVQPIISTYSGLATKYGVDPNAVIGVMGFPKNEQFEVARAKNALTGDIAKLPMNMAEAAPPTLAQRAKAVKLTPQQVLDYAKKHNLSEEAAMRIIEGRANGKQ